MSRSRRTRARHHPGRRHLPGPRGFHRDRTAQARHPADVLLYVYEPGGNRIELCNPVARLVLAPDWRTITWTEAERAKGQAWGLQTIESFHTHGTPPVA